MPTFQKKNDTSDGRAETAVQQPRARTSYTDAELAYMHTAVSYYTVHVDGGRVSDMARGVLAKLIAARMRLGSMLKEPVPDTYSLYDFDPGDEEDDK